MSKFNVTFSHNPPIRPNVSVEVEFEADADAVDMDEVKETARAKAAKRGITFSAYEYQVEPSKIEEV